LPYRRELFFINFNHDDKITCISQGLDGNRDATNPKHWDLRFELGFGLGFGWLGLDLTPRIWDLLCGFDNIECL
jgi:hypothetical protein